MFSQLISERFYAFRHSLRENWTIFDCETEESAEISGEISAKEIRETFQNSTLSGGES